MLLEPTRIYVKPVLALLRAVPVKGMSHITGGGLIENTHRMFPEHLQAELQAHSWPRPALFDWLEAAGSIDPAEMARTFNCGIGFVLVGAPGDVDATLDLMRGAGEAAFVIGQVVARPAGAPGTVIV